MSLRASMIRFAYLADLTAIFAPRIKRNGLFLGRWPARLRPRSPALLAMQLTQDLIFRLINWLIPLPLSMAQADAGIATWDTKLHYDILRPKPRSAIGGFY